MLERNGEWAPFPGSWSSSFFTIKHDVCCRSWVDTRIQFLPLPCLPLINLLFSQKCERSVSFFPEPPLELNQLELSLDVSLHLYNKTPVFCPSVRPAGKAVTGLMSLGSVLSHTVKDKVTFLWTHTQHTYSRYTLFYKWKSIVDKWNLTAYQNI